MKFFAHFSATILLASLLVQCTHSLDEPCRHDIVQSMPDGIDLKDPPGTKIIPTHESLLDIIGNAKQTLSIASFYWMLTPEPEFMGHPSTEPGLQIMDAVKQAAARGVKVEIVLDGSGKRTMSNPDDVKELEKFSTVKFLNMTRLLKAGVLHSKYMIADNSTFYLGSSNFDWRSYTQIKEIGVTVKNCPLLARDLDKIFRTYMLMADSSSLPNELSDDFKTTINMKTPLVLDEFKVFLAGSPPPFNGPHGSTGRTDDIDGLLRIIESAKHSIDISVMNYSPQLEFGWPKKYWPLIDDALRRAATERRIKVRLLFSKWANSKPLEHVWYSSLNALQSKAMKGGIHVKLFEVPACDDFQRTIPYARVKHDKYMVTDSGLYIGTSNWTPDYFTNTCGVGMVFEPKSRTDATAQIVKTMQEVFERDFNSPYAHEL